MRALSDNMRVFCAVVRRDMKVFRSCLLGLLIDGLVIVVLDVLLFGYLFPTMGMAKELIAPVFIGNIIFMLIMIGFSFSLGLQFDLEFDHLINYRLTLPFSKCWLLATYIVNFLLRVLAVSLPPILAGFLLLRPLFGLLVPNVPMLVLSYLVSLLFFALLFISLSFLFSFNWFGNNVWPRILSPLLCLSSDLFPWHKLYAFWPAVANLFLCNPITAIVESLRTNFIGGSQALSNGFCMSVILISSLGSMLLLMYGVKRRLDPV